MGIYIVLKNEDKGDEMVDIMSHLHQYVSTLSSIREHTVSSTGETVQKESATFHPIHVGGDQLTVARARGAIKAKVNSHTSSLPACPVS